MKTIIITGANGNLGMVVTKKFLEKGFQVIATVIDASAKKDLAEHENLQVEIVNLTSEDETALFVQMVLKKYKKVDAALMLVGGFAAGNIYQTTAGDVKKQISLNFETAYNLTRLLFGHMSENGYGRLVFVGARPALNTVAGKNLLAYALGKSLLFTLAEMLNEEAKGKNVTCHSDCSQHDRHGCEQESYAGHESGRLGETGTAGRCAGVCGLGTRFGITRDRTESV